MAKSEPAGPSVATIKRLFAHSGNRCAFPKCQNRLVEGETIVGEICHIKARSPDGPRYDANQTPEQRHAYDNLILMCSLHHTVIDDDAVAYTVERLASMKAEHERGAGAMADADANSGAQLLLSVNQSGGIAAHTIQTLNVIHMPAQVQAPRQPLPVSAGMTFFPRGEVLANMGNPGEQEYRFDTDRFVYLRLIPQNGRPSVGNVRVIEVFNQAHLLPMNNGNWNGGIAQRNKHGAIFFVPSTSHDIASFTQGFASGELWGMNNRLFPVHASQERPSAPVEQTYIVPAVTMEQLYGQTLANYVAVATREYGLAPPFMVEFGIKGILGAHVSFPRHPAGYVVGPIYEEAFRRIYPLAETTPEAINAVLHRYYSEFYEELLGRRRADLFMDNFIAAHGLLPR
ncbi:MAG: hypothetical protein WDN03_07285 [Rhizomicrobium sp.]